MRAPTASTYVWTWAALMLLSALAMAVSARFHGGAGHALALGIAAVKGLLVALFFMHLAERAGSSAVVIVGALILVGFFVGLTAADIPTRSGTGQNREEQGAPAVPQGSGAAPLTDRFPPGTPGPPRGSAASSPSRDGRTR
jgi:caa(3)-type oxidase subunit IV